MICLTGIYKITNTINGKSYIGQSTNIYKRWEREKADSKNVNSRSYKYPLMRAFRKYGIKNFNFEIIEECKHEELNQKEVYWINYYNTFFNGYNQTLGGDTTLKQPKDKIIGIISDLINTDMFQKDIASKWDISTEMVQGINTGRYWKHNADYPLQKRHSSKKQHCEKCGKEITRGSNLCIDCYNSFRNSHTNKPDKETLIKDLLNNKGNFEKVAKKYNVSSSSVRKWCIKYEIPNKSSNYKEKIKPKVKQHKKGVIQIDKDTDKEINHFDSIMAATKSLGLKGNCGTHISDVCKDIRKIAYGYKWKFM